MFTGRCILQLLFRLTFLFKSLRIGLSDGKDDNTIKFGPFNSPHDRTIIEEFDRFAIHYSGLSGQVFSVAHCIFHGIIDVYSERGLVYNDYERVVELLLQRRNYNSPQKLLSSRSYCDNNALQNTPITRTKGPKSIKGVKIATKAEDFCKFSIRCFSNNPITLIKESTSIQQNYLGKWMNICPGTNGALDALFASRIDRKTEELKLKSIDTKKLCQIAARISSEKPTDRVSTCVKLLSSKDICTSVYPYTINFKGWLSEAIDPVKKVPFKFDPKTMIDESVRSIVDIQLSEEVSPYCLPEEIFTFTPTERRYIFFYNKFSKNEKLLINQFLMHFVLNYGKIPRVIFDKRARFAIEGWMLHKNKFPVVSVHNSMYSIGKKVTLKHSNGINYKINSNSGYPYNMPQFHIYGDYIGKPRNYVISDKNPLITPCLLQGCAYFIGRSINMSPVLMIRVQTFLSIKNMKQLPASLFAMFIMSFAEKYLFYPGKVETIEFIIDCRGVSLTSISTFLKLKPIIRYLSDEGIMNIYPLRVSNIFFISNNNSWSTIKDSMFNYFLEETIKSVVVVSVPNNSKQDKDLDAFKVLWKYMSPYILETDIGGLRPCLKSGEFYPFKIMPGPYLPYDLNKLRASMTPTQDNWPRPNFESTKNLHKLVPPKLFSFSEKTMDDNERVSYIDWSKTKVLNTIPKNLWPEENETFDSSPRVPSREYEREERGKEDKGVVTAIENRSTEGDDHAVPRTAEVSASEGVKEEEHKDDVELEVGTRAEERRGKQVTKEGEIIQKFRLYYGLLVNLKQMYFIRLKRRRAKYVLSEQCIKITASHLAYFTKVITETLEKLKSIRAREIEIEKMMIYSKRKSLVEERQSVIEIYIEIVSTLRLEKIRNMLLNKLEDDFNLFERKVDEIERNLESTKHDFEANKRLGNSINDTAEMENKVDRITESVTSILNKFTEIKSLFNRFEKKIASVSEKMNKHCEDLLLKMNIVTSFVDNHNGHDHMNMLESSLLSNIVGSIVKEHKEMVTWI
ncbi:protein with signal peptide and Sec14d domain [Cryptosporidium ryanae]|uniref:protein with signal peptide and Sec14d domain n=1 Tax=Cryptosporidium ryanae TaxID=515981 RepID=UPI003519DA68|nr:protein with signal peptide and Sec14d domain [Cryptosporidium ryanae]